MAHRGHVRRVANVWRLELRQLGRLVSHRLGTIQELPTRAAARRAADRLIEQIAPRRLSAATSMPWPEWCRVYEARHLVLLAKGSRATRASIIHRHLVTAPALRDRLVHAIDEAACQQFITDQAIAGVAPPTVRARFALLRRMLRAAVTAGLAAQPPKADRMTFPREELVHATVKHKAFTPTEVRQILSTAPEPLGTACAVARGLALRASEVMGLTWAAIDFATGRVEIRQQALSGELRVLKSKSSQATLTADPKTLDRLRRYREIWTPNTSDLLFAGPDGQPLDTDVLRAQLHELLDSLGIRRRGFHAFRHAAALAMAEAAVSPEALRRAMRHASLRVTAVYLSASSEDVARALALGNASSG